MRRNVSRPPYKLIGILESKDYSSDALRIYRKLGDVKFLDVDDVECSDINVLVTRLAKTLSQEFLGKFPNLEVIVSPTTGTDHIDVKFCLSRGIRVLNLYELGGSLEAVSSTAEHTLGLILAITRQTLCSALSVLQENTWDRDAFRGRQLSELSLGIVGFGRIGLKLSRYAKPLFRRVSAFDTDVTKLRGHQDLRAANLSELLKDSDVVAITASVSDGRPVISSDEIRVMKEQTFLVNTSRGSLVDEHAVADSLLSGKLAGYGADVLTGEPFESESLGENPIIKMGKAGLNVVVTPHVGGCTSDAMNFTEFAMAEVLWKVFQDLGTK